MENLELTSTVAEREKKYWKRSTTDLICVRKHDKIWRYISREYQIWGIKIKMEKEKW